MLQQQWNEVNAQHDSLTLSGRRRPSPVLSSNDPQHVKKWKQDFGELKNVFENFYGKNISIGNHFCTL